MKGLGNLDRNPYQETAIGCTWRPAPLPIAHHAPNWRQLADHIHIHSPSIMRYFGTYRERDLCAKSSWLSSVPWKELQDVVFLTYVWQMNQVLELFECVRDRFPIRTEVSKIMLPVLAHFQSEAVCLQWWQIEQIVLEIPSNHWQSDNSNARLCKSWTNV